MTTILSKKQRENFSKLGSLIGSGIYTIKSDNTNDKYNEIPAADRLGSHIRFYAVETTQVNNVTLVTPVNGIPAIMLNDDPKLIFSADAKLDEFADLTKAMKNSDFESGVYTDYNKVSDLVQSLNRNNIDRVSRIIEGLTKDLATLEQINSAEKAAQAAYNIEN